MRRGHGHEVAFGLRRRRALRCPHLRHCRRQARGLGLFLHQSHAMRMTDLLTSPVHRCRNGRRLGRQRRSQVTLTPPSPKRGGSHVTVRSKRISGRTLRRMTMTTPTTSLIHLSHCDRRPRRHGRSHLSVTSLGHRRLSGRPRFGGRSHVTMSHRRSPHLGRHEGRHVT